MIENRISDRAKILLIDEDTSISYLIRRAMEKENYKIYIAGSGKQGMEMSTGVCPDLILMDNKFSDMEGITLIQWFREWTDCPIIILSERSSYLDKVEALYAGADDYITKPFSLAVLRARVNAQLRRSVPVKQDRIELNGFILDFTRMEFSREGTIIDLSKTEQRLLRLLVENRGRTLPRELLLEKVLDGGEFVDENALSVAVRRLRGKLGNAPIRTVYGVGYTWEVSK